MAKTSFIPHAWVANICRTSADTLPHQSAQTTCKQVMSFAQRQKCMVTPVKSAQQLGSQTDQVWRQIKPGQSYQTADTGAASVSAFLGHISAVQTHGKRKLYTACLGGWHLQNKCSHLATPECSKHLLTGDELCTKAKEHVNSSEECSTVWQPNVSLPIFRVVEF